MPMKRKFDDAREQFVHVDVVTSGASQYSLGSLGAGLSFLQVKQLLVIASGVRVHLFIFGRVGVFALRIVRNSSQQ